MKTINSIIKLAIITFIVASSINSCKETNNEYFNHILLYQWNLNSTIEDRKEFIEIFKNSPSQLAGMKEAKVKKLRNSLEGFDILISLKFKSKADFENYANSKLHDSIVATAKTTIKSYSFFQY